MTEAKSQKPHFTESPLNGLIFNIVLPAVILFKLSAPERLGPMGALVAGLIFPTGFGLYDFYLRRKANPISILGFISILATGGFGLMHLDAKWFAVKEATIPSLMGIAVLASLKTKTPFVRTLLYNDKVMDVALVDQELATRGNTEQFEKLLTSTTFLLAASFLLSAALNYTLSTLIIKSPAGSVEFNQELGRMTAISYPAIVLPCMVITMVALWRLVVGIKALTGLDFDTVFKQKPTTVNATAKQD
ncbi:MAG: MFS transporter [Deltaproteobacteria bacterium]|nr:MFS transporter [Deltaproteobacteria bacterium]